MDRSCGQVVARAAVVPLRRRSAAARTAENPHNSLAFGTPT
jgi:hypothetical protein